MNSIDELLTRGVDTVYPTKEELKTVLQSGKKLRVYQGFDPTSPELHIGHLVGLRKLKQWQDLGHEVIFLIGDFTGMIGDPTGKDISRRVLTKEDVLENAKTYKEQASKILRFDGENPVLIKYNSEWLGKMSAIEFIELSRNLSIQQVMERDMFQKRFKNNMDVAMSEFLYPAMQGYDSIAMDVDVEVGGTDQMFNMMMGRKLMRNIKKKEKFVMTTPILADSEGKKIGKTEGNAIAFNDTPADFYRKIMALGDDVITKGLEYLTDVPMDAITEIKNKLEGGENPINFKKKLAFEITKQLNGEELAQRAADAFVKPEDLVSVNIAFSKGRFASDLLTASGLVASNSEAKRVIDQGGMSVDGEKIADPKKIMNFENGMEVLIKKGNLSKKVKIVLE